MDGLDTVKKTLKSLRISDPGTVTVKKLDQDFKNMIGHPIPYRKFGYNNLNDFLVSMSDTLVVEGYGMHALVNAHVGNSSSHIQRFVAASKNRPSDRRSNNNKHNYVDHDSRNKPAPKRQTAPVQNQPQEPKFKSEPPLPFSSPAGETEYDEWNPPCAAQKQLIRQTIRFPKTKATKPLKAANSNITTIDTADDYCKIVPHFKMPASINEFTFYPIIVTDVKSPNEFYFQICSAPDELSILMAQMDNFYGKLSATDHQIVEFTIGLYCACFVDKAWLRGRITKVMNDQETVEIALCDMWLSPVVVSDRCVKYLRPEFGQLCQQLARGSLYGVRPIGDKDSWNNEDIKQFEKLVKNRVMYAKNMTYEDSGKMLLVDTNDEDFEINKFLITNGVARLAL